MHRLTGKDGQLHFPADALRLDGRGGAMAMIYGVLIANRSFRLANP